MLLGLAVLSALIYWFGLTQPYHLFDLYQQPLLDLRKLTEGYPEKLWPLVIEFVILFALYLTAWQIVRRTQTRSIWLIIIGSAIIFSVSLLFMYPYDAADIFDNIMHGRILSVYGANPFRDVAVQFPADPFLPYVAWRKSISAYGPGWEIIAGLSARLAGNDLLTNVFVFKLVLAGFMAGCAGLIAAILRRLAPDRVLAGVVLFLWNPVVVYETIGQGHNDVAMLFWMLLAVWLLLQKRYTLTIVALLIGMLFKYIPVLFIPAALAIALRDLGTTRSRWRYLGVTAIVSIALVVLAYAPFWNGLETLSITRRTNLYTTSLPAVAFNLLMLSVSKVDAARTVSLTALTITALAALIVAWRAWRDRSELSFTRSMFTLTAFYLLLTVPWFHAWYAVWIIGLAALLPIGHAVRFALLFSFAVLSKPLIFGPQLLWPTRPPEESRLIEVYLGPLVLALPWLYASYALFDTWRHRARS
jgi:alpha-1,6-mannosyltransferase